MRKFLFLLILSVFSACSPQSDQPQSGTKMLAPSAKVSFPEQARFSGTMDDRLPIEMELRRTGNVLNGTYRYVNASGRLQLAGDLRGDAVSLTEKDDLGHETGRFSGTWRDQTFSGTWTNGKKTFAFSLAQEDASATAANDMPAPVVTQKTLDRSGKNYSAKANYPELSGLPNAAVLLKLNTRLKEMPVSRLNTFVRDRLAEGPNEETPAPYEIEITYDNLFVTSQFISLRYTIYAYEGGAHPNTVSETLTLDLKTGNRLMLSDVLKPGFLRMLSEASRAQLAQEEAFTDGADSDWLKEGTAPKPESFRAFSFTNQGLNLYFDAYTVASYAAGDFLVEIPYSKLSTWLKSGTALESMKP